MLNTIMTLLLGYKTFVVTDDVKLMLPRYWTTQYRNRVKNDFLRRFDVGDITKYGSDSKIWIKEYHFNSDECELDIVVDP